MIPDSANHAGSFNITPPQPPPPPPPFHIPPHQILTTQPPPPITPLPPPHPLTHKITPSLPQSRRVVRGTAEVSVRLLGHDLLDAPLPVDDVDLHVPLVAPDVQIHLGAADAQPPHRELPEPFGERGMVEASRAGAASTDRPSDAWSIMNSDPRPTPGGSRPPGRAWALPGLPPESAVELGQPVELGEDAGVEERREQPEQDGLGRSYLDMPSAIRELSWGQTDPLWYDIGLYRASVVATVRTPQPEKNDSPTRRTATWPPPGSAIR